MKHLFSIFLISILVISCTDEKETEPISKKIEIVESTRDFDSIQKLKTLRVLIENSSTSYFIYKGKKIGFEYDVLKYFAEDMELSIELTVANDLDSIEYNLRTGKADIVACNYTVTADREKKINFTEPHMHAELVLVQRNSKDSNYTVSTTTDLKGKTIHVWEKSSYYSFIDSINQAQNLNINIIGVAGDILGENLIEQVSTGKIDYTVIEDNVADVNQNFYPNINIQTSISNQQSIAFGIRKTSPKLKREFDKWFLEFKKTRKFRYIYHKYFKRSKQATFAHQMYSNINGTQISNFDNYFKEAQTISGWDWRLIASIAYQESKFNPNITSFGGAYGMMQFMPNTGPSYGVYPNSTPKEQIYGGAKKLVADEKYWTNIPDSIERKKFAVASYNSGRGHVLDAQRLASKYGYDSLVWDENVENMILNLSKRKFYQDKVVRHGMLRGRITFNYVRKVFLRFDDWSEIYKN